MLTYLKSTEASAEAGIYTLSQSVPRLGWQVRPKKWTTHKRGSYVFAIRHDDTITPAQAKRAAEATAIIIPGDDAPEEDWIFDYEELAPGRLVNRGRPPKAGEAATGHIHIRTTLDRKSAYVRAAGGRPLAEWMQGICDTAAGYKG